MDEFYGIPGEAIHKPEGVSDLGVQHVIVIVFVTLSFNFLYFYFMMVRIKGSHKAMIRNI
jgi:hypothetical protein